VTDRSLLGRLGGQVAGRGASLVRWLDSWAVDERDAESDPKDVDWLRVVPFLALHASCLLVLWVGWSWTAVAVAGFLYAVRMFAVSAFYHRYFSHRTFKTSRVMQLLFAVLGASAVQRGALWWASHHRSHHRHSDREEDSHSPVRHGFLWSHLGWILAHKNYRTRLELIPDFARYPELRWLDRFDSAVPLALLGALYAAGEALAAWAPGLGTSGLQLVVWGFCISTVVLYHITFSINSVAHRWGTRRFATSDESRNNALFALPTFGEGWHNNHHHYPASVRQGFYWWEIDLSWYLLSGLRVLGLIWDLKPVPARALERKRIDR
jgi:stearoyl-CoA desaturase (delta-9 desaturase)